MLMKLNENSNLAPHIAVEGEIVDIYTLARKHKLFAMIRSVLGEDTGYCYT